MTSIDRELACDKHQRGITVIRLGREYGSADCHTLAQLEECIEREIDDFPAGLLIDLSETIYIGCGFLNVLLCCYARVRERNIRLAFCSLSSLLKRVFTTTHHEFVWEIRRTRQDAIEIMQRPLNEDSGDAPRLWRRSDVLPDSS